MQPSTHLHDDACARLTAAVAKRQRKQATATVALLPVGPCPIATLTAKLALLAG